MHRELKPGIETDLEIESWQALASVPAVKNRRVIMVSGSELPVPGPRIADALEKFEKALRP
jgi:ABC-type hemin transport system substrate-binding protein